MKPAATAAGGFRPGHFAELAQAEATSFWFRGRNRLLLWALQRYCGDFRHLLEIGCGTGYVLSAIARRFPGRKVFGSELFGEGLGFAAERLPGGRLVRMDARRIPFRGGLDVIGAFDVLEHIDDDRRVLAEIGHALEPGGMLLLTVPQHRWLWSPVDDYACHVRRYTAKELHGKLRDAGFELVRSTSFVCLLLPAMLASRLLGGKGGSAELRLPRWLDAAFDGLLAVEAIFIRVGIDLPVGGSRLVIARRP